MALLPAEPADSTPGSTALPATPSPRRAPETEAPRPAGRDRYIDTLRAVALIRVVTYHTFGWIWLPIVFPAMGVMFALGGSLVARSLDRSPGAPGPVLRKRIRRLLPPVWMFGLVVVPAMLYAGWTTTADAGVPLDWKTMLFWIFPVSDPPSSAWGSDFVLPLWYIRTYLWLLLLSPLLLPAFRRAPKALLVAPLAIVVAETVGLSTGSGRVDDILLQLGIFAGCWMLGFAHHDGTLRQMSLAEVVPSSLVLMVAGLWWAVSHPDPVAGWNLDDVPLAGALYSIGAVLLLLRCYPSFDWLARHRTLDKLVSAINSRAMTIYLWGNISIWAAIPLADSNPITAAWDTASVHGWVQQYILAWVCICAAIFAFGWVEDVAARRKPRLNPWPRS